MNKWITLYGHLLSLFAEITDFIVFGILENIGLHGFEAKIHQKIISPFLSLWSSFYTVDSARVQVGTCTLILHTIRSSMLVKSSFTSQGVWCRSQRNWSDITWPHYTLIGVTWPSSGDVTSSAGQPLPYMGRAATRAGWAYSISLYGHERGEQWCDTDCLLIICGL